MDLKRITVLSPSFVLTSIVAVSSALFRIAEAFPEINVSAIQTLSTLPSLIAIPVILLSGHISSFVTKKRIVIFSVCLMLIGGIIPVFLHQYFWQLIIASILFGLGYGGISPLTTALINEHYSKEEQPLMLGFQSAVIGIGGVLFSYIGGVLAASQWWYVYFVYLLFIPILILVTLLPKGEITKQEKNEQRNLWNGVLIFYVAQAIIACCFLYIFQTNIAMLIAQKQLGGAKDAGRVLSFWSIASIFSGMLGGKILGSLKKFSLPTIFAGVGISLLIVFFSGNLISMYAAAIIFGFFFAIRMPAGYLKATSTVPPAMATMAISIYCSASQVGQFLSPLAINKIADLFGLTINLKFLFGGIALFVLAAISVMWECRPPHSRETK